MRDYPTATFYLPSSAIIQNGPIEVERPTKEARDNFEFYLDPDELGAFEALSDDVKIDIFMALNPFEQFRKHMRFLSAKGD